MMRIRLSGLLLVFFLCFASFLVGWAAAVYIVPGGLAKKDLSARKHPTHLKTGRFVEAQKSAGLKAGPAVGAQKPAGLKANQAVDRQKTAGLKVNQAADRQKTAGLTTGKVMDMKKTAALTLNQVTDTQKTTGLKANQAMDRQKSAGLKTGRVMDRQKSAELEKPEAGKMIPFFEEIKENILLLFDPYKIDSSLKEDTHLQKENSYIKKSAQRVAVKSFKNAEKLKKPDSAAPPVDLSHDMDIPFIGREEEREKHLLLKEKQAEYDKKNRARLSSISGNQDLFIMEGKYGFLVNVFSNEKEALEYIQKMKADYPLWSFLIKAHPDHIRIYLGPMASRKKALDFKKALPYVLPFSLDFLEEISL